MTSVPHSEDMRRWFWMVWLFTRCCAAALNCLLHCVSPVRCYNARYSWWLNSSIRCRPRQLALAGIVLQGSMYSRDTHDTVSHENSSTCTTSEIEWPIRQVPIMYSCSNALRSFVLHILRLTIVYTTLDVLLALLDLGLSHVFSIYTAAYSATLV